MVFGANPLKNVSSYINTLYYFAVINDIGCAILSEEKSLVTFEEIHLVYTLH